MSVSTTPCRGSAGRRGNNDTGCGAAVHTSPLRNRSAAGTL